jgi:hypothetical protein
MKSKLLALIGVGLLVGPMVASAQVVYDFTGACINVCAQPTYTGVLELANGSTPDTRITPANFISFTLNGVYTFTTDASMETTTFPFPSGGPGGAGQLILTLAQAGTNLFTSYAPGGGIPPGTAPQWIFESISLTIQGSTDSWTEVSTPPPSSVPEPATFSLLQFGLALIAFARGRRRGQA